MLDGDKCVVKSDRHDNDGYHAFGPLGVTGVIDFVQRHHRLAVTTTAACLALALFYLLTAQSLYTARGQLLIDAKVPLLTSDQWTETNIALDSAQVESQVAVLMSEHLAMAVVEQLNLVADRDFGGIPEPAKADKPTVEPPDEAKAVAAVAAKPMPDPELLRDLATQLQKGLSIRRLGLSYVIEVSFTAPNPEQAAKVANAFMKAYIDDQISVRAQAARQGSEWLERRIDTLRLRMNAAALKVQEFKARRDYRIAATPPTAANDAATDIPAKPVDKEPSGSGLTETHEELESTALTYRKMFESALQAYTEAEQRQSYPVTNARIISSAPPPLSKSSPKWLRTLAGAFAAGMILGFGLALMQEGINFAREARQREASQSLV